MRYCFATYFSKTDETLYLYDGWNMIGELNEGGATKRSCVWGLDLSNTLQGAGGVGGLLAMVEGTEEYNYLYDGNGNVGQLINASTGLFAAHYEYDPFGNVTWSQGPKATSGSVHNFSIAVDRW